jgi:hypothetical protein
MGIEIIFLIKAIFFGLAAIIIIPKELYKKYLVYRLFLGALGDTGLALLGKYLNLWKYKNMGVFNILNFYSFWSPLAWMFVIMFFLYCLPSKRSAFYLYVVTYGVFGYFVGLILQNFGLYEYLGIFKYLAPLVLSAWFYATALIYLKAEGKELGA